MEFVKCLGHPEEFYNLLRFRMGGRRNFIPKMDQVSRASLLPREPVAAGSTGGRLRMVSDAMVARKAGSQPGSRTPLEPCPLARPRPPPPPVFKGFFLF